MVSPIDGIAYGILLGKTETDGTGTIEGAIEMDGAGDFDGALVGILIACISISTMSSVKASSSCWTRLSSFFSSSSKI
jgi:hypothetical protein